MHGSIVHEPPSNGPDSRHDLLQWLVLIGWSGALGAMMHNHREAVVQLSRTGTNLDATFTPYSTNA
jgi:hypothetical protein